MAWKKAGPNRTLHNPDCNRVFRSYDMKCPRCIELAAGLKPRSGWGEARRIANERFIAELKAHDCKERNCGIVCTFGDW